MFDDVVADLVGLTDAELDEFIREQELARRAAEAKLAAAIAVADARSLPAADGHRSMSAYLRATCNWSPGECARLRGASATVDQHPEVGDAWLDGRVGPAQVAELSKVRSHRRAAERFDEFVPLFLDQAERLPLRQFKVVLQRFVQLADADGTVDEREAIEGRIATVVDANGELHLRASGGHALATAEFIAIVQRFVQREFEKDLAAREAALAADDEPPPFRTGPQRRFDALMAMARSADAHDGPVRPAEPLVSVLVDQHTMSRVIAHAGLGSATSLTGNSIDPFTGLPMANDALEDLLGEPGDFLERRCETDTGVPLRPTDVLRSLLSGRLRRVVLGAERQVVDLGRSSRVFTGAARDAARLLTVTCDHPGCDVPADWCQVDHSTEWHELGPTDQANAGVECRHHNVDKHRRRRRTRRAGDGRMYTFRPDGTIMLPVGCRPPRFDPDGDDPDDHHDGATNGDPTEADVRYLADMARARLAVALARR